MLYTHKIPTELLELLEKIAAEESYLPIFNKEKILQNLKFLGNIIGKIVKR